MSKVRITVTSKDIKNGIRGSVCACPVALASQRRLCSSAFRAGPNYLYNNECRIDCSLPSNATNFINAFDEGQSVLPFEFDIDVDLKALRGRK